MQTCAVLDVVRALCIAVARAVRRTGLVAGVLAEPAVGLHLDKVEGTVEAAGELGHVDVERELLVLQLEKAVGAVVFEEVGAGTDVDGVRAVGDEVDLEGVARRREPVCTLVVARLDGAVAGAGCGVGADRGVPGVARVAISRFADLRSWRWKERRKIRAC